MPGLAAIPASSASSISAHINNGAYGLADLLQAARKFRGDWPLKGDRLADYELQQKAVMRGGRKRLWYVKKDALLVQPKLRQDSKRQILLTCCTVLRWLMECCNPQAPVKTRTAVGKMLDYYLRMEPHLFDTAIEKQLTELQEEKETKEQQAKESPPSTDQSELVLYRYVVCNLSVLLKQYSEQHSILKH